MLKELIKLIYPERCIMCGNVTLNKVPLCDDCIPLFYGIITMPCPSCKKERSECRCHRNQRFLFYYHGKQAKNVISKLKHNNNKEFGKFLGDMIFHSVKSGGKYDCVVYPPRSEANISRYGFDQMSCLSETVASRLGIPCVECLERQKASKQQKLLSSSQRRKNVKSLFVADKSLISSCKRVLLLDDVSTTGSTLLAAKHALREAGVDVIGTFTVAKTPKLKATKKRLLLGRYNKPFVKTQ